MTNVSSGKVSYNEMDERLKQNLNEVFTNKLKIIWLADVILLLLLFINFP